MILNAKVIKLDEYIEEEVLLEINETKLTCFTCMCPYKIVEGKVYPVELNFVFLDKEIFKELSDEKYEIKKLNESFSYKVCGKVEEGTLNIGHGIKIKDEMFEEYACLEGGFIELIVDRISVDFV
jgi:hypothetical protein